MITKSVKHDPWKEFSACAECDSQEPIGKTRGGIDPLFVCPDCGTVEGKTRPMWLNTETDEVTAVMPTTAAEDHEAGRHDDGESHTDECPKCQAEAEVSMRDALRGYVPRVSDLTTDADQDAFERRLDAADEARKRAKGE